MPGKAPKRRIPYLTYIGMDEFQGGYQSGQRLIAAGAKSGVCVNHQVGHAGLDARCKGSSRPSPKRTLRRMYSVSSERMPPNRRPPSATTTTAHPDVNAWLTLGPSGSTPFYAFVDAQKPSGILHGTFDVDDVVKTHLQDGSTLFAVDQQPYAQGYMAVMYLMLDNRYGIKPALPVTATGPGFVTKDSLARTPVAADKPLKFSMVQHALCAYDPYWCVVEKGMEQAAKDMGIDVTIMGPDKFDVEKTAALIDQAVATKPDGMGATITDNTLFKPPLMKAIDAGIPVVAYDTGLGPDKDGIPYLTFWGAEDYVQGYYGGKKLVESRRQEGRLHQPPGWPLWPGCTLQGLRRCIQRKESPRRGPRRQG